MLKLTWGIVWMVAFFGFWEGTGWAKWHSNIIHSQHTGIRCQAFGYKEVICTQAKPHRTLELIANLPAAQLLPRAIRWPGPLLLDGDAWGTEFWQCYSGYRAMICTDYGIHGFRLGRTYISIW